MVAGLTTVMQHIEQAEHDTQEMWKQAEELNESGEVNKWNISTIQSLTVPA